ncbi:MAG: hypothetical protein Q9195_005616 [Heterodermia aff. obscurata]
MAGFLSLPLEIRTMIYEFCLVVHPRQGQCGMAGGWRWRCYCRDVSHPFGPYKFDKTNCREKWKNGDLTAALLSVSKTIGLEAAQVLYGKNKWPLVPTAWNPIFRLLNDKNKSGSLWSSRAPLFRHVIIDFALTNERMEAMEVVFELARYLSMVGVAKETFLDMSELVDELYIAQMFRNKVDIMKQMTNLSSITIHYDQMEMGLEMKHKTLLRFCRIWGNSGEDRKLHWPPLSITITGLDHKEIAMVQRLDREREWIKLPHGIPKEEQLLFGTRSALLCSLKSPYFPK